MDSYIVIENPLYLMDESFIFSLLEKAKFDMKKFHGLKIILKNDLPNKIYIRLADDKARREFKLKFLDYEIFPKSD